jgi:DNA repair protein RadD
MGGGRMTISLRPYQQRAIDAIRSRLAAGVKRILIVGPTGCGKTTIFAYIAEAAFARSKRVLIIAHRRELLKAPLCRFMRAGITPSSVGVILAGVPAGPTKAILGPLEQADDDMIWHCMARRRPDALGQIASIDTIRNRAKPPADIVIRDEAHRALSASDMKVADAYPDAVFLGLTASPVRLDGKSLGTFYEEMITVATYADLSRDGFLVEPRVLTVPAQELPDLARVRLVGGDYDSVELGNACDTPGLTGSVTEHWLRHAGGVPTIGFAVNRQHSMNIVDRFRAAGVSAAHVDALTPTAERDAAFKSLCNGTLKVLMNVGVAEEGIDLPPCACVIMARPSASLRVFLQQAGRGSRPYPGKSTYLILDHAGNVITHGWPSRINFLPEVLHNPRSKSSVSAAPAKTCPQCFACVPASCPVCPECSWEFVAKPRGEIEEQEGHLVEVCAPSESDLRNSWSAIVAQCLAGGYAPGWCLARWSEQYPGTRPPAGCVPPSAEDCAKVKNERALVLDEYLAKALVHGYRAGWIKNSFRARTGHWPTNDMFMKCRSIEVVRGLLAGLGAVLRLGRGAVEMRAEQMAPTAKPVPEQPKPHPVANDTELVEYDLGA